MKLQLIQILSMLIISATSAFAQLGISIKHNIYLPHTHGVVRNIVFQDYDFDGVAEIAYWDDSSIAVYSVTGDSLIWSITSPIRDITSAALDWREVTRELLFADCNRDSIPDITALTWGYHVVADGDSGNIAFFDGASGFSIDTVMRVLQQPEYPVILYLCNPTNGSAAVADFDGDGFGELLYSFIYISLIPGVRFTNGGSAHYYSFPDSLSEVGGGFIPDSMELFSWPDGSSSVYVSTQYTEDIESLPYPEGCVTRNSYGFLTQDRSPQDTPIAIPETLCVTVDTCLPLTEVILLATGNVDANTSEYEFIVQSRYRIPDPNRDTFGPMIYITENVLSCYRATGGQTVQEVWSHQSKRYYRDGVYLSQYPGFFFAFDSTNTLVMFRGDLGTEFHKTAMLPSGKLSWANIYPDSSARLIASHDSTIEVYSIEASTPVTEHDKSLTPTTFQLGAPYPNPFNPVVTIPIDIPRKMKLTVTAYNILGEQVATIFEGKKAAGQYRLTWNAVNYPSGIYFISVTGDSEKQTKKISLIK